VGRRVAAALVLALQATTAFACGFCVEDKLAAVYDHELVGRALGARHHVAFCGIEGVVAGRDAQRGDIARALDAIAGVDRGQRPRVAGARGPRRPSEGPGVTKT